jgi:quercetin dioxygenase-like cupin family protein
MLYRDLIDDRLGGSIIASHIRIPEGGPVPDMVHYHTIGFQLIFCLSGWVRLVYEDQGPPFILNAGDCVTQPPKIRHRVLESSDNLEVLEIGVPAEHLTTIDHDLELPTHTFNPQRLFDGQMFCHSLQSDAQWVPSRLPGFEHRETGISVSTANVASVVVHQPVTGPQVNENPATVHDADILFSFVKQGQMKLQIDDTNQAESYRLQAGDAFVIPPGLPSRISECAADLQMIEVSLPGTFATRVHS